MSTMSVESDDDEFGVLQSNTPNIPRKKIAQNTVKPSGGNHSRAEAGPSRAINNATLNKRKKGVTATHDGQSDNDEVEEIVLRPFGQGERGRLATQVGDEDMSEGEAVAVVSEESGIEEVEEVIEPSVIKVRAGSKKPAPRAGKALSSTVNGSTKTNTAALTKGKGKQKATPVPKKSSRQEVEPMDTDLIDILVDEMEVENEGQDVADEQPAVVVPVNLGRSGRTVKPAKVQHPPPRNQKKDEHIARLERQLQQAQDNLKELTRQLDELCQVRKTEPEQLMERMETHHQALMEAKDTLLADLTAQLAKRDPVLKSGKKSAFELLTRDEANSEMYVLQEQLKKYREAIQERDQHLKEQQKEIEALKEDKRIMGLELKEEVRRNQELNARAPPPSSSRPRTAGVLAHSQDPKYAQIITFYEDLTNVIVPNMRMQNGKYLDLEEWILNCCYTHKDVVNKSNSSPKSINFNLRLGYEPRPDAPKPITNKDDLVPSVFYTPLELQNESKEFRESLEFLGDNFTFERDQLSLFVRTLHEYISGEGKDAQNEDDEESSDNSVRIVE